MAIFASRAIADGQRQAILRKLLLSGRNEYWAPLTSTDGVAEVNMATIGANRKKSLSHCIGLTECDLFSKSVPFDLIDRVMLEIEVTQRHQYRLTTRYIARMVKYFKKRYFPQNLMIVVSGHILYNYTQNEIFARGRQ